MAAKDTHWEYMTVDCYDSGVDKDNVHSMNELNRYGLDGWELVQCHEIIEPPRHRFRYIFKRELPKVIIVI